MITKNYQLDMHSGGAPVIVHLSQYDSDFSLVFNLYSSSGAFTIESGTTAAIRGTKSDGMGYSVNATLDISNKKVTVTGDQQMTAVTGKQTFELTLTKNNKELNTANFILDVERAALDKDTLASDSVIKELVNVIDRTDELIAAADQIDADKAIIAGYKTDAEAAATSASTSETNAATSEAIARAYIEAGGISDSVKTALLQIAQKVAYIDADGQTYYNALYNAFYSTTAIYLNSTSIAISGIGSTSLLTAITIPAGRPVTWMSSDTGIATVSSSGLVTSVAYGSCTITAISGNASATCAVTITEATLTSIDAVYTQSGTVYDSASLSDLKSDLVVTATWSDGTTTTVPNSDYVLSGTLSVGTSTITVSYGGKTTQFTVNVSSSNVLRYPGDNIYLYKQSSIDPNSAIGYGLVYSYTSQKVTFVSTVGDYPIYDAETEQPMTYYPIAIPSEANGITITPTVSENYKLRALAREFSNNRYGEVVADTKWQSDTPVTLDLTNAGNNPKYLLITMQGGTSATIGTIDVDALEIEFTV